jgi:anthranilate phosphoribosyltransferase
MLDPVQAHELVQRPAGMTADQTAAVVDLLMDGRTETAAGVPVAKHGNRGSARPNGSFDLLEALGVPFQFAPAQHLALQRTTGICFLFARQMHPTVAAVTAMRRMAGRRTIFNIAGPLANPCRPRRQIIGVIDAGTAQVVIDAVRLLDRERTVVVCGHPGIDEISISGPTHVWDIRDGHCRHAIIERICQPGVAEANLPGGDAAVNADLFADLLADRHRGPLLDMVLANAGTALDCWHGRAIESAGAGFAQARGLVAQGAAWACYGRHRSAARQLASLHP